MHQSREPGYRLAGMLLGLLLAAGPALPPAEPRPGGNDEQAALQQIADQLVAEYQVPGMLLGLIRDGQLVARAASGIRHAHHPEVLLTSEDCGHLGSCGKALTATLAGLLVDQGRIEWDDTIEHRLPGLAGRIDPAYHEVTLGQLLKHRGGVPANGAPWRAGGEASRQNRMEIVARGLETRPGERVVGQFAYSNLGYLVAALMMESATGETWEDLMRIHLLEPLQLESAGYGPPSTDKRIQHPWGHAASSTGAQPVSLDNPPSMAPAGTLHMNLEDWARFARLHLDPPAESDDRRLTLSGPTRDYLHQPGGSGTAYAGGWLVRRLPAGQTELSHEGSNTFWLASIVLRPGQRSGILVITNQSPQTSSPANQAAIGRITKLIEAP